MRDMVITSKHLKVASDSVEVPGQPGGSWPQVAILVNNRFIRLREVEVTKEVANRLRVLRAQKKS